MHEMALTQGVVDAVCEHAAGRRVHSVKVEVGALCEMAPESMRFYFGLATEGTLADGARLDIEGRPGTAHCNSCGAEFELSELNLSCRCGSTDVDVLSGREMKILSIDVS